MDKVLTDREAKALLHSMFCYETNLYAEKNQDGSTHFGMRGKLMLGDIVIKEYDVYCTGEELSTILTDKLMRDALERLENEEKYTNAKQKFEDDVEKYNKDLDQYKQLPWYTRIHTKTPEKPSYDWWKHI